MKYLSAAFVIAATAILAGCARAPEGTPSASLHLMTFRIEFDGPIVDSPFYHYFVAIDTSNTAGGLQPVFPIPGITPPDEWLTSLAAPSSIYYVEYTERKYTLFRIDSLHPFHSTSLGTPFNIVPVEPGGKTLRFTINLDDLETTGDLVGINIITTFQQTPDTRRLDGLGLTGTEFLRDVNIRTDHTITNIADPSIPEIRLEPKLDVLDQDRGVVPDQPTPETAPIDISDWTITMDV